MTDLSEIAKKMGKKGGETTKRKYGAEHYRRLAENMNRKIKEKKDRARALLTEI